MTETAEAMAPDTEAEVPMSERSYFISYAHKDQDFVDRLAEFLRFRGAANVWVDHALRGGDDFSDEIKKHILECSHFLVVWSPDARKSHWVTKERQLALDKNKRIVPLLYRKCPIPQRLKPFHYVDAKSDGADGFGELIRQFPPPWYRRFLRIERIVGLGALLAVLIGFIYVALKWHSNTSVSFTRAGDTTIYARVQNTGLAPSTMQSYWLRFGGGPIQDINLVPVGIKPSVIPGRGQADLALLVRRLDPSIRPGTSDPYTCEKVHSLLKNKKVTLEIEVNESNAPGRKRNASFDSFFIHNLIENRLICKEE